MLYLIDSAMKDRRQSAIAQHIRVLAERYHIVYSETPGDRLAHHITRLADGTVELDEIERLLIGLQRAGHLSIVEMITLQAQYLREASS